MTFQWKSQLTSAILSGPSHPALSRQLKDYWNIKGAICNILHCNFRKCPYYIYSNSVMIVFNNILSQKCYWAHTKLYFNSPAFLLVNKTRAVSCCRIDWGQQISCCQYNKFDNKRFVGRSQFKNKRRFVVELLHVAPLKVLLDE